jgi:very-short-patch-repair endonuclease
MATARGEQRVLVCVLKSKRDLALLLRERWYRIPVAHAPTAAFGYLAFYQPATFGRDGKRIRYYARVLRRRMRTRRELLPEEPRHPRAHERYIQFRTGPVRTLAHHIRNTVPRRVSFGFTTLRRLRASRTILQLFRVAPTEQIIEAGLRRAGIAAVPQYRIRYGARQFRLDFAIPCKRGAIALECDNTKAHAGARERTRDRAKDVFLARHRWRVIRLPEPDIVADTVSCIARVARVIRELGGQQK